MIPNDLDSANLVSVYLSLPEQAQAAALRAVLLAADLEPDQVAALTPAIGFASQLGDLPDEVLRLLCALDELVDARDAVRGSGCWPVTLPLAS